MAETEAQADTECVCTVRVLCTNATEDSEPLHMKKEDSIYVSIIGPIYATGSDYGDTAVSIMHDYFMWDDEEKDWEEYILWREGK